MRNFIIKHFPMTTSDNVNLDDIKAADTDEYRNLLIVGWTVIGCTAIVAWKGTTKVVEMLKDAHL